MSEKSHFTMEIIENAFNSLANEMFWNTIHTSQSPIFYETFDFATGITDPQANTVSISIGVPLWAGTMRWIAGWPLENYSGTIKPGDVIICNEPYHTGTHKVDIGLVKPIFYDEEIIALTAAKGHVVDIGGMHSGSWGPGSEDIYQEGLYIPPVKYYKEGEPNKDVINLIGSNSRLPSNLKGDLEALAASLTLGGKRIKKLVRKYGVETVKATIDKVLADGRQRAKNQLKKLPKGKFSAKARLQGFNSDEPLKFSAEVEITDEKFRVDLSDNPEQLDESINCPYPSTYSAAAVTFIGITNPHVPSFSQGLLEPLEVIAPEGTIFNPQPPAPVSVYWEVMAYASDLIWKALAPHIPDKLSAGHFVSVCAEIISGIDPRNDQFFILVEPNPGGWGGCAEQDGESCLVAFADGETYVNPAEVLEREYPVLLEKHKLNTEDRTGPGKFRGGFGIRKEYRILTDKARLTAGINRTKYPPWGVEGGKKGTVNYIAVERDGEILYKGGRVANFKLKKGDIVRICSGGGGGWGNPLDRDPEWALNDVNNRLISIEDAKNDYGVVIDPETLTIDEKATRKVRQKRGQNT